MFTVLMYVSYVENFTKRSIKYVCYKLVRANSLLFRRTRVVLDLLLTHHFDTT